MIMTINRYQSSEFKLIELDSQDAVVQGWNLWVEAIKYPFPYFISFDRCSVI